MRKILSVLLLSAVPILAFSEVVFIPQLGFDAHKGIKMQKIDDMMPELLGKWAGVKIEPEYYPNSRPLTTMFTIGLDMHFISKKTGFTFFWNHAFSYASRFRAQEKFFYNPGSSNEFTKVPTGNIEHYKFLVLSSEMLLGGTFRRERAFNIHFGIGFKTSITPATVKQLIDLFKEHKFPDKMATLIMPSFGGSIGVSYYFNNFIGLSLTFSDFLGFGAFVAGNTQKDLLNKGKLTGANGFISMGLNNNFSLKLGVNLRVNGVKGEGF